MSTKSYATFLVTIFLTGIATPPLLADNSASAVDDPPKLLMAQNSEQFTDSQTTRQTRGQPDTPGKSCDHKGKGDPNHCNNSAVTTETTTPVKNSTPTPQPAPAMLVIASQPGNCEKRDAFETEEEFQARCKKTPEVQKQVPKTIEQAGNINFSVLQDLKKSSFETDEEFQTRRNLLLQEYNQSVTKRDPRYQAGVVNLDKDNYDLNTGLFPLFVKWQGWAAPLFVLEKGNIQIQRQEAKALWEENVKKASSVFVTVKLADNAVVADEAVLLGLDKEWKINLGGATSPAERLNPVKDSFESDQQFQARKQKLLEDYHHAVQQRDPRFQAGVATLQKDKYSEGGKRFPMNIQWQDWAKEQFDLISGNDITVERNEAIELWGEGPDQVVLVDVEVEKDQIKAIKPMIIGLGREFLLSSLDTEQEKNRRHEYWEKVEKMREECEESSKSGADYLLCWETAPFRKGPW